MDLNELVSHWKEQFGLLRLRFRRPADRLPELERQIDAIAKEVTYINHFAGIRRQFYQIVEQAPIADLRNEFWDFAHRSFARDNFRFPNPIFGNKVVAGRLETNSTKMKIIRLVVELRDRQRASFGKIAVELNCRGHRNRRAAKWNRVSVGNVHKNWTGKV